MKKKCIVIITTLMVLLMSCTVLAYEPDLSHRIDELGMTIDFPSSMYILTRDMPENDPILKVLEIDKASIVEMLEAENTYLVALRSDDNTEIVVTMTENILEDFNTMGDSTLTILIDSFIDQFSQFGVNVEKYEIYNSSYERYLKMNHYQETDDGRVYSIQYYTVCDSMAINITMRSYNGPINNQDAELMESIVETAYFENAKPMAEDMPDTDSFVYVDESTGCEFTVPANWNANDKSQEKKYLKVMLTSKKDVAVCINYSSMDLWEQLPESEKRFMSRRECNNDKISAEVVAESLNVDSSMISKKSFGQYEYFFYSGESIGALEETGFNANITACTKVDNGFMYIFNFITDSQGSYYEDFEELMESVKFPATESTTDNDTYGETSGESEPEIYDGNKPTVDDISNDFAINIFMSLLFTILIYTVPIIFLRYCIIKHPVEKSKALKITVVYGVIAFFVMHGLIYLANGGSGIGGAIVLWSFVNYMILIKGNNGEQ